MSLNECLGITTPAVSAGGNGSPGEIDGPETARAGILSVIIPAYNVSAWIERCVESIEGQGDVVKEIIVVNDGSEDRTEDVVRRLQDRYENITLINQNNQGLFYARIHGVCQALGDYVTFVDADDYIESDTYRKILPVMIEKQADILEFGVRKVKDGNVLYEFIPKSSQCNGDEAIRRMLERDGSICSNWNKIYRNALFLNSKFDENIRMYEEDKLINVKVMARAKQVISIPLAGYVYETREESITTKAMTKDYLSVLDSNREIYRFIKKEKPSLSKIAGRDFCARLVFCFISLREMGLKQHEISVIKKELKKEFRLIYKREKTGSYRPESESKNRTYMLSLFRLSPAMAEMIYRMGRYFRLLR